MIGFGADTWCVGRLVPGRLARGPALVLQALYNRLITTRGTLRGGDQESVYGFDVASFIGAVGVTVALQALPELVGGELRKDDRVASVGVTAAATVAPNGAASIVLTIDVLLEDESTDFQFTIAATSVSVDLIASSL